MKLEAKRCTTDDEVAAACLFLFERKKDLHPSFTSLSTVTLLYRYVTEGRLVMVTDREKERVVAVCGYFYGTPEQEYDDRDRLVLLDIVIIDRDYRRTRVFVRGFQHVLQFVQEENPHVTELRFVAQASNRYVQALYGKFAEAKELRDSELGPEQVYAVKIHSLKAFLNRFG
jgi:hypothetical protein